MVETRLYNQAQGEALKRDSSGSRYLVEVIGSGGSSTDLKTYILNDFEVASSTLTYLGKEKNNGTWLVVSIDSSTGQFRFANVSNNSSLTTYTTAYAARATLTYDILENLTGL